jgi:hypothetical protein
MTNFDSVGVLTEIGRRWMAIGVEMTDYTRRSFEEGSELFVKLLAAKSPEQAVEIQSDFAKRAYDAHLKEVRKISGLYADFAKGALQAYRGGTA